MTAELEFCGGEVARGLVDDVVLSLYLAIYRDRLSDEFYSGERFLERFMAYSSRDGFELAVARVDGRPVAQAFGYPLPAGSRWWDGLVTPVPPGFTDETGRRTFALNELMVVPEQRRRGVARALHDGLMARRAESRATLLVRADNDSAKKAYAAWGYRAVAQLKPFADSPTFEALIIDLPLL